MNDLSFLEYPIDYPAKDVAPRPPLEFPFSLSGPATGRLGHALPAPASELIEEPERDLAERADTSGEG